jgi:hypothetical protein
MKVFFNYINLLPSGNLEEQCNLFAAKGLEDHKWAIYNIIKFLQYQKERVEQAEITGGTLRNFVKTIFNLINDNWNWDKLYKVMKDQRIDQINYNTMKILSLLKQQKDN